jgi:hypothetical protein
MKTSGIVFSAQGRFNTKARRIKALQKSQDLRALPDSYTSSSVNEELCFEYVKSYIAQFKSVYPNRQEPFLISKNEYGVEKFVCSTLRPSLVQFTELYDMHECAVYLAGYVLYEPLDPPGEPPASLPSPGQVLKWHIGDSFDMANLLCSILLGSGYDAYVVHGYAPRHIALQDQSRTQCPLISKLSEGGKNTEENPEDGAADAGDNPYAIPDNALKPSAYIEKQKEQERLRALDKFVLWGGSAIDNSDLVPVDDETKRVHAWVLVRSGRREVKESVFIEPSTGRAYPVHNSPYIAIEALWNCNNFWINTDLARKPSEVCISLLMVFGN